MSRLALVSVALFAFINTSVIMKDVKAEDSSPTPNEIDPIVTGQTLNDDYMDEWETQREKYLECGSCAVEPQPYPGD